MTSVRVITQSRAVKDDIPGDVLLPEFEGEFPYLILPFPFEPKVEKSE